jgi:uncharacterized membrane protein
MQNLRTPNADYASLICLIYAKFEDLLITLVCFFMLSNNPSLDLKIMNFKEKKWSKQEQQLPIKKAYCFSYGFGFESSK